MWPIPQEKSQLHQKLQECERRLRLLDTCDTTDGAVAKRYPTNVQKGRTTSCMCDQCSKRKGDVWSTPLSEFCCGECDIKLKPVRGNNGCRWSAGHTSCKVKPEVFERGSNTWTTWSSANRGRSKGWLRRWERLFEVAFFIFRIKVRVIYFSLAETCIAANTSPPHPITIVFIVDKTMGDLKKKIQCWGSHVAKHPHQKMGWGDIAQKTDCMLTLSRKRPFQIQQFIAVRQ